MWESALVLLVWVLLLVGCWSAIFRKAGYSAWWGLVGIMPIIPFLWLAYAEWPVRRQLQGYRAETPQGSEDDAYALLDEAGRLERQNKYEEALATYERVAAQRPDAAVGNDARVARDALRERLQREAAWQEDE